MAVTPGWQPANREAITPGLDDSLIQVVAVLADGNLVFPPPFDLRTSAALADNTDTGDAAEQLFTFCAPLVPVTYRVTITAVPAHHPETGEREIINTRVTTPAALKALLGGLVMEIAQHPDTESGTVLPA